MSDRQEDTMSESAAPEGFHTVTPLLIVADADRAMAFYAEAFGAVEVGRLTLPDGKIAHAEVRIGDSLVMLADENPEWDSLAPGTIGGTASRLHLYVEDADATVERAVAAGATVAIPVDDQFYGDRSGRVTDPFGHSWIVATRVEEMSLEEMQRRMDAWAEGE